MKMIDKNKIIKKYIQNNIALSKIDENKIDGYFDIINNILEKGGFIDNFISGSIGRKTSGIPMNDIDIICPMKGDKNNSKSFQFSEVSDINKIVILLKEYFGENKVRLQSHSIGILIEGDENGFSIDIVPAIQLEEKNKDGNYYLYEIPSNLLKKHHNERTKFYEDLKNGDKKIKWEKTDPRGYIYEANQTDNGNNNFRLGTLFLKNWKNSIKEKTKQSLKSFHIEEYIKSIIKSNDDISLYETIKAIENINLNTSVIKNRADNILEKNIDFYITENDFIVSKTQINLFIKNFIISLKEIDKLENENSINDVLDYLVGKKERCNLSISYNQPAIVPSAPHFAMLNNISDTIILSENENNFLKKNIL